MTDDTPQRGSLGVDLGTTNSLVAYLEQSGTPDILTNHVQETYTPSVVGLRAGQPRPGASMFVVGRQALNNANRDPRNTIRSIKRFMGLPFSDPKVTVAREHVAYEVLSAPGEEGKLVVRLGDDLLTPEEVSALILGQLRQDAEARLGPEGVGHVVITCPAYFNEPQRKATHEAGIRAGLRVKALLDEPTAAYLSESRDSQRERERVLVVDFGGGTLDISLIQRQGGRFNVMSYTGDNFLGGDDIDMAIAGYVRQHILEEGGEIPDDDARFDHVLKQNAEQAKKALCGGEGSTFITIPAFCRKPDGSFLDVDLEITQEIFGELIEPVLGRIAKVLDEYLSQENYVPEHFDEVLLVGGSSAVPHVQQLLREMFEGDGQTRVRLAQRPMAAVALGAALYAGMIKGVVCPSSSCKHENEVDAEDCTECGQRLHMAVFSTSSDSSGHLTGVSSKLPWSLGVRYQRSQSDADAYRVLLDKGATYPTQNSSQFRVPAKGGFKIEVYEGDDPQASKNRLICIVQVSENEVPKDVNEDDEVDVEFIYGRDRTLLVAVSYPTSRSNFNPRWQVSAPVETTAEDAVKELTALLPRCRQFLEEYGEFIEKGTRAKIEGDLNKAETAVMAGDAAEAERLQKAIHASMFTGAGVASTLFLAEKTIAEDDPRLGPTIKEGAARLRVLAKGQDSETEGARRSLEALIAEVFSQQRGPRGDPSSRGVDITEILRG
ncbi:Hsp70 family protein [Gemmatimonadota bacterium]